MSGAYDDLRKTHYTRDEVLAILERTVRVHRIVSKGIELETVLAGHFDDKLCYIAYACSKQECEDARVSGQPLHKKAIAYRAIARKILQTVDAGIRFGDDVVQS